MRQLQTGMIIFMAMSLATIGSSEASVIDSNGERPKGYDRSPQASAYGGEKEDLRMQIEDVQWEQVPCKDKGCTATQRVKFTVWVEWLNYPGPWLAGLTDWDSREPAETTQGPDALIVEWGDAWTLVSASDNPSGSSATQAYWSGESNCPERPTSTGRTHDAPKTDGSGIGTFGTFGFSRTIELVVNNPANTCVVPTLQVRTHYLHTYDDDLHISWNGDVGVGISVDADGKASVGVSTNVNFSNNHGWNKSAFESIDPPADSVVRCDCCEDRRRKDGD